MARTTRTKEERIADLDAKILKKKEELAKLETQKQRLEHPISVRSVISAAKEAGLSPEEIAEKLGLEIE
ncbi:hypothetical protein SDC9_46664 [bioreactor metagenome]|uniref:Uncharacterized protein n=1 Tax=bioreactor metagenome TaxID=1076179 RepID=A0A644W9H6_9ZZZZ